MFLNFHTWFSLTCVGFNLSIQSMDVPEVNNLVMVDIIMMTCNAQIMSYSYSLC